MLTFVWHNRYYYSLQQGGAKMKRKVFSIFIMTVLVVGSINLASAQELGRKGARKSRHTVGAALGTRSYLDNSDDKDDFFHNHPDELVPADLRGNSYNIFYESTPSAGLFGVELLLSYEPKKIQAPNSKEHEIQALLARLSGRFHPLVLTNLSQYADLYVGGGITGITFKYETEGFSQSYKANGPHLVAGFEYYLGTFAEGKWRWGAYVDYLFTPNLKLERVGPDRKDFNAGGHLFIFGAKFNAVR